MKQRNAFLIDIITEWGLEQTAGNLWIIVWNSNLYTRKANRIRRMCFSSDRLRISKKILSDNLQTLLLNFYPPQSISTPLPPYPLSPSHLPFFPSSHPFRPPSSHCTGCLLSPEELKVALIWSPGFLQIAAEGANASEPSSLGTNS